MSDSVFSKIIKGDLPSTKEYESENILVIRDINPVAPVHLLIITKTPYTNLQSVPIKDLPVLTEVFEVAQSLATKLKIPIKKPNTNRNKKKSDLYEEIKVAMSQ